MPYDDPTSSLQPLAVAAGVAAVAYLAGSYLFPSLTGHGSDSMSPGGARATIPGLQNWGNWCFANAVLQALSSSPALRAFLTDQVLKSEKQASEPSDPDALLLTSTLWQLLSNLTRERPGRRSTTLTSMPAVRALASTLSRGDRAGTSSSGRRLQGYVEQQDAQEFVQLLCEGLCAEANDVFPATGSLSQVRSARGQAYIPLPLEGELSITLTCARCLRTQRQSTTPFITLTTHPRDGMSLDQAAAEALDSTEKIDDYACFDCVCDALDNNGHDTAPYRAHRHNNPDYDLPSHVQKLKGGNVRGTVIRRTKLLHSPKLLCLHVQRSMYGGGGGGGLSWFGGGGGGAARSGVGVTYGKRLRVEVDGKSERYELRAIVTHRGAHDRGHYVCLRRVRGIHPAADHSTPQKPSTRWYAVSDETVNQVTLDHALQHTTGIFLAFYERLDDADKKPKHQGGRRPSSVAAPQNQGAKAEKDVETLVQEAAGMTLDEKEHEHKHENEQEKENVNDDDDNGEVPGEQARL
ncbi:ubiquitin-specific protease ubp1 [Savitreella phatthalungensis]